MGLVEKIKTIRGMPGLNPRTKANVLRELLEPFIDNKHHTFKAEKLGTFKREYQRAPRYMGVVIQGLYGLKIMQNAAEYLGRPVQERTTTEVSFDLRGLEDSPDVGMLEGRPPRP